MTELMDIKIKACYHGNILIDDTGITTYDKEFEPSTFNLIYKNGFFYLTPGEGYHQYKWNNCALKELQVRGNGIYHINMNYDSVFTLIQERAKVYLFNDLDSVIIYNYGGEVSGTGHITNLRLRTIDGVIKHFTIKNFNMFIEKYSTVDIKCLKQPTKEHKIKKDNTSEVIINDIKVENKFWPKF